MTASNTRSAIWLALAFLAGAFASRIEAATWTVDSASGDATLNACTAAPADCSLPGALQRAAPSGDTIVMEVASSSASSLSIEKSLTLEGNNALMPALEISTSNPVIMTILIRNARWEGLTANRPLYVQPQHRVTLEDVVFRGNSISTPSGFGGGAIMNFGHLTLRRGLFEDNEIRQGPGGAIVAYASSSNEARGSLTIEDSRFDGNYSDQGGSAIHHTRANNLVPIPMTIRRSTFLRNGLADPGNPATSARGFFGAIKTDGPTHIEDSYFADNDSRYASAIQSGGTLTVVNSTFYRNITRDTVGEGGAMLLGGTARFANLTLVENSGTPTGGLYVYPGASVQLVNSLLADNLGSHPEVSGTVFSLGNNLIKDPTGALIQGATSSDLYNVNAHWQAPADNGGATFTVGLFPQSPAIDAGSICVLHANGCGIAPPAGLGFDQRGPGFPRKRGNQPDIGAFESNIGIVRNTEDSGTWSLRQTISEAVAGDRIRFATNLFFQPSTISLLSTLVINKALTIEGPGADRLTLDAGRGRRHLNVDAGGNLVLSGLRFTRGDPGGTISGGALLVNSGGTLDGRELVFEDNAAHIGGCVYNVGTLTLSRVRLSNCRARAAAGAVFNATGANATFGDMHIESSSAVDNGGAIGNAGNLLAFRVAMIGNQARFGGAFSEYGTTTLRNSTISGNSATGAGGGGIHVDAGAQLTLTHATVTRNTATTQGGGGVWNNGGVVEIQNTVVDANAGAGGIGDVRGALRSFGHNLIGNTAGMSFAPDSPSLVGNQLGVSARLAPLADNGGFGPTHAPNHDSPLFDAGASALGFDGRGLIRPRDLADIPNAAGGNGSDVGAYELQVATPSAVVATAGESSVSVAFTGGARGGLQITEYSARCGTQLASGGASPLTVAGLENGVEVSCTVTAYAGTEAGIESAPSNGVTPFVPIVVSSPPPVDGSYRQAYTHQLIASGMPAPVFDVVNGSLPPGLALDPPSGLISGLPTVVGTFSGTLRASNGVAPPAAQAFSIQIAATAPDAPIIGTAVAGDRYIEVHFTPPQNDGGSPIIDYTALCSFAASGSQSPIVVNNLTNGVPQRCQVFAINAVGGGDASAYSNEVTPQALTTLALTSNTATVVAGTPVTFIASVAPLGAGGLVSFSTGASSSGCAPAPLVAGSASCTTSFTAIGSFPVSANYAGDAAHVGSSGQLAGGQVVIAPTIMIDPDLVNGVVGAAWGPVQLQASGGAAPYVFALTQGSLPPGFALSSGGLLSGTPTTHGTFSFTVTATDSSQFVGERAYTLQVIGVPSAPSAVVATRGNGQVTVDFVAPTSDGGSAITGYTATCGAQSRSGSASPIVVTGLTNGTAVTCSVVATNAIGTSAPSVASNSVTPATLPGAPVISGATPGNASATVAFLVPSENGGADILDYTLSCTPGTSSVSGASSPLTVVGLGNGVVHACSVSARNAVGSGPASAPVQVIPNAVNSANLAISKTNATVFVTGGLPLAYTIIVSNAGPAGVVDARVQDTLGPDFSGATWTCVGQGGASCAPWGNGSIDQHVVLPMGSSVQFLLTASLAALPETPVSNIASVTPPTAISDPDLNNNVASDGPDIRGLFRDGME